MTDRDKAIEVMALASCSACKHACGSCLATAQAALTAYESHLQASGMAVVPGWQRMPTENIDLKAAPFDRKPFLGTLSNGWVVILSAPELPWRYAWWNCQSLSVPVDHTHAPDSLDESLRLVAWMPLIAPADFGKAPMQEASAERSVANSNPVKERDNG